jgi:hypothetical protein
MAGIVTANHKRPSAGPRPSGYAAGQAHIHLRSLSTAASRFGKRAITMLASIAQPIAGQKACAHGPATNYYPIYPSRPMAEFPLPCDNESQVRAPCLGSHAHRGVSRLDDPTVLPGGQHGLGLQTSAHANDGYPWGNQRIPAALKNFLTPLGHGFFTETLLGAAVPIRLSSGYGQFSPQQINNAAQPDNRRNPQRAVSRNITGPKRKGPRQAWAFPQNIGQISYRWPNQQSLSRPIPNPTLR